MHCPRCRRDSTYIDTETRNGWCSDCFDAMTPDERKAWYEVAEYMIRRQRGFDARMDSWVRRQSSKQIAMRPFGQPMTTSEIYAPQDVTQVGELDTHCYVCDYRKPRTEFYRDRSRRIGVSSKCKSCSDLRRDMRG